HPAGEPATPHRSKTTPPVAHAKALPAKPASRAQVNFLQEQECRSLSRCSPTVESARAVVGVLSQLRKSIPSTHAPSRCSRPVPVLKPYIFPHRKDMGGHTSWPPPSRAAFKPLRSRIETRPSTSTSEALWIMRSILASETGLSASGLGSILVYQPSDSYCVQKIVDLWHRASTISSIS